MVPTVRLLLSLVSVFPHCAYSQDKIFKGESCMRCHAQIRDRAPGQAPGNPNIAYGTQDEHDVIVIGGGLAGLTAAYSLRTFNVLLLEKESQVGGKVRADSWGQSRYPVAAGYMVDPYSDIIKKLFDDLGLERKPIPEPTNSLYLPGGKIVHDPFGEGLSQLPDSDAVKRKIKRIAKDMNILAEDPMVGKSPPVPEPPQITARILRLDSMNFEEYMRQKYGPEIVPFINRYSLSLFGIRAKEVSALAGLSFFSTDFSDAANITWDGGPGIISEKLAARVGTDHIQTNAMVTAVTYDTHGVWVEYYKDEKRYLKHAKTAVVAVPSFVAKRLVMGLPEWKKQALSKVRYSAYIVALIAMDKPIDIKTFDLWSSLDTIFTDIEPEDWGRRKLENPPPGTPAQILEAFVPLGEREGRAFLTSTADDAISERVVSDLDRLFPGSKAGLHGVRIIRWGHAMPVDYPLYLTKFRTQVAKPIDKIFFAGVDTQMPCIEGAIESGYRAADQVRAYLKRSR